MQLSMNKLVKYGKKQSDIEDINFLHRTYDLCIVKTNGPI